MCRMEKALRFTPAALPAGTLVRVPLGRRALLGNIDVDLLARGSPEEIRAAVQERIREVAPGGGFAIGSSNSVPDYVPDANYFAMLRAAMDMR